MESSADEAGEKVDLEECLNGGSPEMAERREERLRLGAIEVRSCVATHARRLARNMMLRYRRHLKPHRITVTELQVLAEIALKPGVTAAALSASLELNKSTVSRIAWREAHRSVLGWLGDDAKSLKRLARRVRPPPARERCGARR